MKPTPELGQAIDRRLHELASISSSSEHLTRLAFTPEMVRANALAAKWMQDADMTTRLDAAGNLIGRYEGFTPGLPALVIGSHLDTVENAGRFDGTLGVVSAICCVEEFHKQSRRFPFAIEIAAFGDEEGVRFGTSVLGSLAFSGSISAERLALRDAGGLRVDEAIKSFGCEPSALGLAARQKEEVLAYVEVHIEQGPVLETKDVAVACVSGIFGSTRLSIEVSGRAGHAGTTPMNMRQDALVGAAEMVLATETLTRDHHVVATVGKISVEPSAINVIPGRAHFTIDARALHDKDRAAYLNALRKRIEQITLSRNLLVSESILSEGKSAPCAAWLQDQIVQAIERAGLPLVAIPSGAGHDGAMLSNIADFGMIFVRCRNGVSHHPDEFASDIDMATGAAVLHDFIANFNMTAR